MAPANHVPDELIEDILSRVPMKLLFRFKIVSKKCYSLLSQDSKFYLKQSKKPRLVFFKVSSRKGTLFRSLNVDTNASCKFKFPFEIGVELIGSANGLVCVAPYYERCCFIWNPCTGEYKKILVPIEHLYDGEGVWERILGFGYDSCSDDYKIVAKISFNHFQVFSLKTDSWKIVECAYLMRDQAFHLNRALHWCLSEKIVAFDLAKERFSYIELPDKMKVAGGWRSPFTVPMCEYQGLLCVSWKRNIWITLNYGDSLSWVRLSTSLVGRGQKLLGVSTLGEIVYRATGGFGFVKYDIQGRLSYDDKKQLYYCVESGFSYTESLISPKCFDALHTQSKTTIRRPRKQSKITAT